MPNAAARWILLLPDSDPFGRLLARSLARPGRSVELAASPATLECPAMAVIDLSLPKADDWLRGLKLAREGEKTGVVGLLSADVKDSERRLAQSAGTIRVRPDRELREPFSHVDVACACEQLAAEHADRPGLRTLAIEYVPDLVLQDEAARLIESRLTACGLPEPSCHVFVSGVREALDNARLHGACPQKPADRARVWLEADQIQIMIAIADDGAGLALQQLAGSGETPLATARRRNKAGRPGGLGLHIMRLTADEVRYEPDCKRVMLVKWLAQP